MRNSRAGGDSVFSVADCFLNVDGAPYRLDDRRELGNHCIAPGVHLTTVVPVEQFQHDLAAPRERCHGGFLVGFHETAEPNAVSAENGRELTFQIAP